MVKAGEIYLIDKTHLRSCRDARPCVVLQVSSGIAWVCCLSSQFDCAAGDEVTLMKTDPEFVASGLKKDSYIANYREIEVSIEALKDAPFLGRATGEFKKKIEALFGAPLS